VSDRVLKQALQAAVIRDPVTDCPDDNTVAAYLDAALPAEQRATLETHASACSSCRELIGLAITMSGDEAVTQPDMSRMPTRFHGWLFHPIAAVTALSVVAVGIAVLLVRTGAQPPHKDTQSVTVHAPAQTAAIPAAPQDRLDQNRFADTRSPLGERKSDANLPRRAAIEQAPASPPPPSGTLGEARGKAAAEPETDKAVAPEQAGAVFAGGGPPPRVKEERPETARAEGLSSQTIMLQRAAARAASDEAASAPAAAPRPIVRTALNQVPAATPDLAVRNLKAAAESSAYPQHMVGSLVFYRVGSYWIDSRCRELDQGSVVELKADSPELSSILSGLPDLSGLDAPGIRIVVAHEGKVWVLPER
jgi:hypothetical protein